MTAGYVTRPRHKLREEVAANKQRRKEDKRVKIEAKIDKLQGKLAAVSVADDKKKMESQKGHGK